ncbi:AAA family ATPase [Dactylosporangium sp. NBC_01737]|uniref:nSTAND1 domain-containing NTPase n=1 Tax=Dactylosporangium sp. NBC_01737 TaxID=2975959 RepID=UPI002E0EFD0D|nr:AAA family ATPase [Dactylosporangium sp. NBC_01737]
MGRWGGTGYGTFLLGTGMGLITNLITGDPSRWPSALQPVATYSPAIGAGLLVAVGAKAAWDVRRGGIHRPVWSNGNPWPGLTAYTSHWAGVYFGRTREAEELLARVRDARSGAGRFVPVVGPSGSGKSSLVLAGLLPSLGDGHRVLPPFTPGTDALGEFGAALGADLTGDAAVALAAARAGAPPPRLDATLAALTARRDGARRVVLVVDQLEETVTQGVEEDRHAFLAVVEALLAHEPRLRVVATVRSDTIGEFQQGPGRDLFRDPLMVNVMGPRELRLVVEEPARLAGVTFDDGLVDEIVRDTGGGDALPLLSYLLNDLYRTAAGDRRITWREYHASGGVAGAIGRRAEAAVRDLGPGALPQCLDTLLLFVTLGPGGATRQRVPAAMLDDRQRAVVAAFVEARLLTSDDDAGAVFDIAHEALLRQWQPLAEHIVLHEESLRRLTELAPMARAWTRAGRLPDYLIGGARLADALTWARSGRAVAAEVVEFLDASERNQAGALERRANSVARQALDTLDTDPELAFALAWAAHQELAATELAARAVASTLASGLLRSIRYERGAVHVAFSPDGRLATAADVVDVWGADGTAVFRVDGNGPVAFAPDGRLATVVHGVVHVWDATGQPAGTADTGDGRVTAICWADGGLLATADERGAVRRFDAALHDVGVLSDGQVPVYALTGTPGGGIAAGRGDGSILVWDAAGRMTGRFAGGDDNNRVLAIAAGPGGRLASGTRSGAVRVWDLTSATLVRRMRTSTVNTLAFGPDGTVYCGTQSGTIAWDRHGNLVSRFSVQDGAVTSVGCSADGRLAVGTARSTASIWDVADGTEHVLTDRPAQDLGWTPDGRLVIVGPEGFHVWAGPARPIAAAPGNPAAVRACAASWTGPAAAVTESGSLLLYDTVDAPPRAIADAGRVTRMAFAPDGRWLATGATDGTVRLWDTTGNCRWSVDADAGRLSGLACAGEHRVFAADGELVAITPGGSTTVPGDRPIHTVAGGADGRLAVADADGTITVWDRPDGVRRPIGRHSATVTALAYAPDGRLISGADDGEVRLWDAGGQPVERIRGGGPVTAVAVGDAGLAYADSHGTVRIRPCLATAELARIAGRHHRRVLTAQERERAGLPPAGGG